jgi:hypothetical protein
VKYIFIAMLPELALVLVVLDSMYYLDWLRR